MHKYFSTFTHLLNIFTWLWRRFTKENLTQWGSNIKGQFGCHIWWSSEILIMFTKYVFDQFWWLSYMTSTLTSLCMNLFVSGYFANLLCSPSIWIFDIWYLFDNLTLDLLLKITSAHHRIIFLCWNRSLVNIKWKNCLDDSDNLLKKYLRIKNIIKPIGINILNIFTWLWRRFTKRKLDTMRFKHKRSIWMSHMMNFLVIGVVNVIVVILW